MMFDSSMWIDDSCETIVFRKIFWSDSSSIDVGLVILAGLPSGLIIGRKPCAPFTVEVPTDESVVSKSAWMRFSCASSSIPTERSPPAINASKCLRFSMIYLRSAALSVCGITRRPNETKLLRLLTGFLTSML